MENYIFKPNGSAFLILLLPIPFFASLLYQEEPNLYLFIFLILILLFSAFMCNRKINKICISENEIIFLPFWGYKPTNRINFSNIKDIKIIKNKITFEVQLTTIKNEYSSITLSLYKNNLELIALLKRRTPIKIIEPVTTGVVFLGLTASLFYVFFDLIDRLFITKEHHSPFINNLIVFCVLLMACLYIGFKITSKDSAHKGIIITFCAVLATSLTYALTISCYLYNEHYPASTHYVELKLNKKDGNYQTWQLSDEAQKILMIKQERLSTYIKPQQLPENVTLTQDSNYQATIQTGLLNDIFIVPKTVKPVN